MEGIGKLLPILCAVQLGGNAAAGYPQTRPGARFARRRPNIVGADFTFETIRSFFQGDAGPPGTDRVAFNTQIQDILALGALLLAEFRGARLGTVAPAGQNR